MKVVRTILITSCMTLAAMPVYSGTLIESIDQEGEAVTTRFEGGMMRADMPQPGSYMIFDLKKEKAYVVDESEHMVMDLSAQMWGRNADMAGGTADRPEARLVKQGKGPTIAGYPTVHYKVMVGDTFCGDEYLSSRAMSEANMQEFGEAMSRMAQQQAQMAGDMGGMMQDPCVSADRSLYEAYLKHGMPLRSVNKDGAVDNEVKRIQTDASISADYFKLPKGYPVMTMDEMMQQQRMSSQRQMENMPGMSDMPSNEEMMKMRKQLQEQIEEMQREMERRNQ